LGVRGHDRALRLGGTTPSPKVQRQFSTTFARPTTPTVRKHQPPPPRWPTPWGIPPQSAIGYYQLRPLRPIAPPPKWRHFCSGDHPACRGTGRPARCSFFASFAPFAVSIPRSFSALLCALLRPSISCLDPRPRQLFTVTVSNSEVRMPVASRATTESVWMPLAAPVLSHRRT